MNIQTSSPELCPNIYTQLLAAQEEFPTIDKDSVNPHLKNKYASLPSILNTVLPVLRRHGVLLTSGIKNDMPDILQVNLIHAQTGTKVESDIKLLNTTDMQKWGGSVTYATRYGLLSLLGISADLDDDGHMASTPNPVRGAFQPKVTEEELNNIGNITFELYELWKKKEGSVRADGSDAAKRAVALFKSDLVGINYDSLVKLKKWLMDGNFVDVVIPSRTSL